MKLKQISWRYCTTQALPIRKESIVKKNIVWSVWWTICIVLMALCLPLTASADDAGARKIMQKVLDRDDGDNRTAKMEMLLIDKRGKERLRKLQTFQKDKGKDRYGLLFFLHPADVKDTAFLTYDYDDPDHDDDQWLYLPALRKTKRIASTDKSGSFMGSDLNYSDMTDLVLKDYDFFLKKEMEVGGHKVWVIESIPRSEDVMDETGYSKTWHFIRQDIFFQVRAISWIHKKKALKYLDVKALEKINGIWVATEMHIFKKQGKKLMHKTILKLQDVQFDQPLDYNLFTTRKMETGL
jgi:hypothetical protein